ncbi:hypothetical protein [Pedobacter borealis]|uniref:hypothetical protein n=1 Tax=Pedobacter borealis TaxID=475254 RepID=UPI0004934A03|nr:hypothetical protein [Pedobacter borealis]
MFESFYPIHCSGFKKSLHVNQIKGIWYYSFRTENYRYIVEVEFYVNDFYVVQYYTTKYKTHPKKFQILTNEHKCRKIVGTCVQIMLGIWKKNPLASFGFIGANTYDPETHLEEPVDNTQRWKIYKHAMEQNFGPETFKHGAQSNNSRYVMLNKKKDVIELNNEINQLFEQNYDKP